MFSESGERGSPMMVCDDAVLCLAQEGQDRHEGCLFFVEEAFLQWLLGTQWRAGTSWSQRGCVLVCVCLFL